MDKVYCAECERLRVANNRHGWISTKQAASTLNLSQYVLMCAIRSGAIEAHKRGGTWHITQPETLARHEELRHEREAMFSNRK